MKKYIILIVILILIGVGLSVFAYQKNISAEKTDASVVVDQIGEMESLNNELNVLLFKSRFGIDKNYDNISNAVATLRLKFVELQDNGLAEVAENNSALKKALDEYSVQSVIKFDLVENFKTNSSVLTNSAKYLPILGEQVVTAVKETDTTGTKKELELLNNAVLKYLLDEDDVESKQLIRSKLRELGNYESKINVGSETLLLELGSHLKTIIDRKLRTQQYLVSAVEQPAGQALNELAEVYADYNKSLLNGSNDVRNAFIVYGIVLLAALIFFTVILRKKYISIAENSLKVKYAYAELKESQEQLIQSEKMVSVGQVVVAVANEINAPLDDIDRNVGLVKNNINVIESLIASIKVLNEEARSPKRSNAKITQYLHKLLNEFQRRDSLKSFHKSVNLLDDSTHGLGQIKELVNSLRDFSQVDAKETESINIHDCIDDSLSAAASYISPNNIEVIKKYRENPSINFTPSRLNQLFLNVIINAAQAMSDGGMLTIKTQQKGDNIIIVFEDTGVGMSKESLKKIFDPFYTTQNNGEGAGLGMSISYKIVESHGGKITAASELGKGSRIRIVFPVNEK